ncbi:hypothetical protein QR680_007483 [Steinernema hermaphroditum]|uniref:ATP-dependent DNA helicase n=1 Tax=Steinernema hermaphroditum TaxID=289476 RepID=A0AA39M5F6_9BILA|nr:hypothetical protein QR680_007483 [Steinernema hermaphroditum]
MFGAKKPTQLDTYTGTIKYYYVNGIRMDDLDLMQYKTRCEVAALRRLDDALEEQRRQREEAQKAKREAEQLQQQPQQKDSTPEEAAKRGWSLLNAFKISLQTIVGGGRASATRTAKKRAAGVGATATRVAAAAEVSAQSATAQVTRTLTPCTQDELGTAGDAYGFVQNGRGLISMAPQTWLNGEALCRILCDEIRQLNTALQPEERTAVADPQFWEYRFTEHYRNYEEYEAALRQNVTYGISLHMHGDTVAFGRVILPIHLTDHWALGILNVSTNQVIVYNSLEARDTITHPNDSQFEQIAKLQQWAAHIVQDVLHRAAPQEPCSVQFAPRTLQLYQKDGYNCGIHVIDNALHYLRAVPRPEQGVGQMRVVDIREPGVIDIKTYANRLRNEYRARLMRMYPHVVTSALRNFADDIAQARRDMQKALDHRKAVADRSVIPVDAQGKRVQPKAPQVSYEQAKANEKRLQEALAEFNAFHATIHAQQQDTAPQQSTSVLGKVIKVEPASQKKAAHENPEIADLLAQMRQMESEENSEDDEEADTASMDAVQQGMDFLRSQMKGYTQQFDGTAEYSSEKARQDRHRAKNRETLNANKRELMSLKRLSQTEEERAADNAKRRSTKKALTDEQRAKRTEQQHLRRTIKKEEEEEQKKKEKMTVLSPVPPQPSKRVLKMDPKNVKRRQKNAEKRQAAKRKPEDTATDDAQNLVAFTAAVTKDPVDFVVALEQIQTTQDLTKHAASLATSIRSLALNSPASTSGPRRKRRKTKGLTKIHYKTCQLDHPGRGCAAQSATHRVPPWSPGTFNIPCQHCGARMNPPEKRRGWTGCCHGGKVDAEHMKRMFYLLQNPPQLMKELTDPDHVNARDYLANDRKINAHFAMGSITTNRDTTLPRGPNVVKLNNEMQPRLSDLCRSSKHEQPTFGQYYALKAEEAINYRLKTDIGKGPLGAGGARSSVIAAIDRIIRQKHALASSYSFAAEKFEEACRQAELNNEPIPTIRMTLLNNREAKLAGVQDPNIHTHRTEIPATEQVAVIWISNDDNARPPDFHGIDLHNTPDGTVNMGTRGSVPLVLPTCFPILDPFGLQGYRFGLPNKIKEDADRAAAEAASAMEVDGEIFYDARDVRTQKSQSSQKKADSKHPDGEAEDDEQPFEEANKKDADAHGVITYDGVNHDMQFNLVDDPEDQQKKKGDLYADPILFSQGQVADADEKEDEFLLLDEEMINELAKDGPRESRKFLSFRQWIRYLMMMRDHPTSFHWLWSHHELAEYFTIVTNNLIEKHEMHYYETNAAMDLRESLPDEVISALKKGLKPGETLGRVSFASKTYKGGRKDMQNGYANAKAITRHFGQGVFFLTFTGNAQWECVDSCLRKYGADKRGFCQKPQHRPDVVCRQFYSFVEELLKDISQRHVLGKTKAYFFSVEHQKRGMPHIHMVIIPHEDEDVHNADFVDAYVSAEIPPKPADDDFSTDMAYIRVSEDPLRKDPKSNVVDYDENAYYRKVRYMTSMEAMWRLLSYPIYRMSHVVQPLYVHDPRGPVMKFKEGEEEKAGKKAARGPKKTKLTAYFDLCTVDPAAKELRFDEVPKHYVFKERQKKWVKRKNDLGEIVTRVGTISPANKELFAIRLLLLHRKGVTSWEDLRTVTDNDGNKVVCETYARAAELLGLTESDAMWMKVMDAAMNEIPSTNRRRKFLAMLIVHNQPSNPMALIKEHLDALCPVSSRRKDWTDQQRINYVLNHIQYHILEHGLLLADVGLEDTKDFNDARVRAEIEGDDEQITDTTDGAPARADAVTYADQVQKQLNANQADVYKEILDAVDGRVDKTVTNPNHLFFVTGEGGTGKTFLFNALIARVNARKSQYVACASTGIAALLLQGGSTAHKAFCINNDVRAEDQSRIKFETYYAQRIRDADLIIIDEVSMMHRVVLEYIEKVLKSCYTDEEIKKKPFCGKVVVLSGDFKQLDPVPFPEDQHGAGDEQRKAAVLTSSLKCSKIFEQFKELKLTENMRMDPAEVEFRELVRNIGLGRNFIPGTEFVQLPADRAAANAEEVISFCYPDEFLKDPLNNVELAKGSNVLMPRNNAVFKWNDVILNRMRGRAKMFLGIDRNMERREDQGAAMFKTHQADHDLENIHMECPTGVPPYKLKLKIGAIIMLIRNLSLTDRLCNGTMLQVMKMTDELMVCRRLDTSGQYDELVYLPKIRFIHGDGRHDRGVKFSRIQYPTRLAFVNTINKAQGQTLKKLGLILDCGEECFAHGQLYVALSRVRNQASVLYYSNGHQEERKGRNDVARNIIYHELVQEELTDEEKKALEERRRAAEHELEILATQAATPAEPPPVLTIYDLFQPTDLPTVDVGLASFTVFNKADALDCFNGKEHISELAILRYLAYRVR